MMKNPRGRRHLGGLLPLLVAAVGSCADTERGSDGSGGSGASSTAHLARVGLSHVATLLPLPKDVTEKESMLKPGDVGAKGRALPDWAMPLPSLTMLEDRATTLANLRLVGSRLDPCFPNIAEADETRCQYVLHLVWQPIVPAWETDASTMAAVDAAIHSFHQLRRDEFLNLLSDLAAMDAPSPADTTLPLGVHPVIAAQGLDGAYARAHRAMVLRYAGENNLFETTFLAVRASLGSPYLGQGWLLSGSNYAEGRSYRVVVASTSDNEMHFGNNTNDADLLASSTFAGDVIPPTSSTDLLLTIARDSKAAQDAPLAGIEAAVDQSLRVENPLLNTLDSTDCVSCHIATSTRTWAQKNRGVDLTGNPNRYTNANFDLTLGGSGATRTNSLHGFGYYATHVALTQRTVNDAAAAADVINARLLPQAKPGTGETGPSGALDPSPTHRELAPFTLPPDVSRLGPLAVDPVAGKLYAVSGARILRGDLAPGSAMTTWVDLGSGDLTTLSTLRVTPEGHVVAASSSDVVTLSPAGTVLAHARFTSPFPGGGFGGPLIALSPDGQAAYLVESGAGSTGSDGLLAVHVARLDLAAAVDAGSQVEAAETWSLGEPFKTVDTTVSVLDAAAPFVSLDGQTLYVPHVPLREIFAVDLAPPHTVRTVDTQSLQRSATATSLDASGLLTVVAAFDQTVPIFKSTADATAFTYLDEIPVGLSLASTASHQDHVFIATAPASFFGGGAPPGGSAGGAGGAPPGGLFGGAGGAPGGGSGGTVSAGGTPGPGGASSGTSVSLRVFSVAGVVP